MTPTPASAAPTAQDHPDDGRRDYMIPLVVFTRVLAVDPTDATYIAERALHQAFVTSSLDRPDGPLTIQARFHLQRKPAVPVEIHDVGELNAAYHQGALRFEPTGWAYRRLNTTEDES